MPRPWQKINGECHYCHSWQDLERARIDAMNLFLAILLIAASTAYLVYLAAYIHHDGYGSRAASGLPRSHHRDMFDRGARV